MFDNIMNWIIDNKDSLISNVVVTSFFIGLGKLWILRNKIPNVVKTLINIKGMKYLGFILLYILPLGTIVSLIIDQTTEPTFKNISLFIVIVATLFFNILIGHIRTLYKLNTDLIKANSKKMTNIDQTFTKVYEHIEKTLSYE